MFQIVEVIPTYCRITDACIGSQEWSRSHLYLTHALALKIAERQAQKNYDNCGESDFVVVVAGGSAFRSEDRRYAPQTSDGATVDAATLAAFADLDAECPF